MKNFNRRDVHGHHGSKCRELAQHAHSHISHAFTHTLTSTQLQPCGAQLLVFSAYWVFSCFRNPLNSDMVYRIFIVRTRSFLCLRVHTGFGHTDSESAQHFRLGKTRNFFLCAPDGILTIVLWIRVRHVYLSISPQWGTAD